ncbi:Ankyrin-3 [Mizuhopecten yessoensis]|uniref:Ankyrin-3 n=1 Tax=Mizuhopecten yessoensis TaxID=6573 RepID=A0A210Q8L3_MIZYE|nr:Ankyrin-3 [Mizuhopecten yessoensis]
MLNYIARQETLCDAVENNDEAKVIQLLKQGQGCRPNSQNKLTCLHIACQRGYQKIARHLLDHGFNIHALTKEYKTPLHESVCRGQVAVARELLRRGASTESKDIRSSTPLFVAAQNCEKQMVKLLLEFNASVEAKNALGQSPLHVARTASIIKILASKGLDIDIKGDHGCTPLHCASRDFDVELIKTLLDLGADPTVKNKDGNTPRDLAEPQIWQEDKTALDLLREAEKRFDQNPASNSKDYKNMAGNSEDVPVVNQFIVADMSKDSKKSAEKKLETPGVSGNQTQKETSRKDQNARPECNNANSTTQSATYQLEKTIKDRCLGDISDKELGRIAGVLDKKQAKQLRRMVPKASTHRIEEDEKGNCRNQYFQLLKVVQSRNRKMYFADFKKRIKLTRSSLRQMSHQERICMEIEIEKFQLTKIKITNLRLTTVLSMVVSKHYYMLGIELGLASETMNEIHELTEELLSERCHQTLRKAKERFPRKTCADIVRAIANLEHDYHRAMELLVQSKHYPIRYQ